MPPRYSRMGMRLPFASLAPGLVAKYENSLPSLEDLDEPVVGARPEVVAVVVLEAGGMVRIGDPDAEALGCHAERAAIGRDGVPSVGPHGVALPPTMSSWRAMIGKSPASKKRLLSL